MNKKPPNKKYINLQIDMMEVRKNFSDISTIFK